MTAQLTPAERQTLLRKLKHGPALDREDLARYAQKLQDEILKKRENAQA